MKTMKLLGLCLSVLIQTAAAEAQTAFIAGTGLTVQVKKAEVVDQKTQNILMDEAGNRKQFLIFAHLKLDLEITDQGCSLEENSSLYAKYTQGRPEDGVDTVKNQIDYFLTIPGPDGAACTSKSRVIKTESIRVPLVNGVGAGASKDISYTYVFNTLTKWGIVPSSITVVVNQEKRTTLVNLEQ